MDATPEKLTPRDLIPVIILLFADFFSPLLITRRWNWWEAWVFGFAGLIFFVVSRVIAYKKNPDIIIERGNTFHHKDIKSWDKIVGSLVGLLGLITVITAGIEALYQSSPRFSLIVKIIALVFILGGYCFASWALIVNRFFSGVVRIQKDRGQHVISSAPYSVIRHPGYASSIVSTLATPFFLDSLWGVIPAALFCAVLLLRTSLEDKTLRDELEGYSEYTLKVRYRIFPGVW